VRGFEVLRQLRARTRMPVLMLTARGNEQDRILGLEMGADDYLPKPFNPRELCARIEAILRRSGIERGAMDVRVPGELIVDDVSINKGSRIVRRRGETIELTTVEFDLLEALLRNAGSAIARDELVRTVLNRPFLHSIAASIPMSATCAASSVPDPMVWTGSSRFAASGTSTRSGSRPEPWRNRCAFTSRCFSGSGWAYLSSAER
jgi:hypothetical protein